MTENVSRRTILKTLGASGVVLAGGATAITAQSQSDSDDVGELEILYEFEPSEGSPQEPPFGQHPENVAVDPGGNKYVSIPSQAQLWKFGPDDEPIEPPFVQFESTEEFLVGPTGVEYDPSGRLYSAFVSDLSTSDAAETNGVYEIDDDGVYELYAEITNDIEDFPSFPNDIALLENSLLVTDSFSGVIWEVSRGQTDVWAGELWDGEEDNFPTGPLAPPAPSAEGPQFGPNGLQFTEEKDILYVANTAKGTIVRIPIDSFGNPDEPEVFVEGLSAPDGLAMDTEENLYVADNGANQILRISPDGDVEVLAENEITAESDQDGTATNETVTNETATNETATNETVTNETVTETETTVSPTNETATNETETTETATTETATTETAANVTTTAETETTVSPTNETATNETATNETATNETTTTETATMDTGDEVPVLDQPADVTFGTTDDQLETLYIVNLALNSIFEEPKPSFMKLDVGAEGLPVER